MRARAGGNRPFTLSLSKGVLGAVLLAFSCGPTQVQGSLSTVLDLHYDQSTLEIQGGQVATSFLRSRGPDAGYDLVLKVGAALDGGTTLAPNEVLNLADVLSNGGQRGQFSRNVLNDPYQVFPPIDRGEFFISQKPTVGTLVNGYFTVTFTDGIDISSGRTAYANFQAKVIP